MKLNQQIRLATITLLSLVTLSCTPEQARAGFTTSESKAWSNESVTTEIGANYGYFNVQRYSVTTGTRSVLQLPGYNTTPQEAYESAGVHYPAVPSVYVPPVYATEVYEILTPTTVDRVTGVQVNAKVSQKIGKDLLGSISYDQDYTGSLSVRNGAFVGSIGSTIFQGGSHQLSATATYTPVKNISAIADFRRGQTSIGLQLQKDDMNLYGVYSPTKGEFGFGVSLEFSGN